MMKFVFLSLILIALSCKSQKNSVHTTSSEAMTPLLHDNYSGVEESQLHIIKDAPTLQKFFATINRFRKPGIPVPEVDFNDNTVLLYFAGKTPVDAQDQVFTREETEEQITLGIKKGDSTTTAASAAIGTPFQLYIVPQTKKEIVFSDKQE